MALLVDERRCDYSLASCCISHLCHLVCQEVEGIPGPFFKNGIPERLENIFQAMLL